MSKRVLIHGADPTLLETRRQVLSLHGLVVDTVLNGSILVDLIQTKRPDLLVVCSSLPPELQQRDVRAALAVRPEVKCFVVSHRSQNDSGTNDACQEFYGLDGPERFVTAVQKMLVP